MSASPLLQVQFVYHLDPNEGNSLCLVVADVINKSLVVSQLGEVLSTIQCVLKPKVTICKYVNFGCLLYTSVYQDSRRLLDHSIVINAGSCYRNKSQLGIPRAIADKAFPFHPSSSFSLCFLPLLLG